MTPERALPRRPMLGIANRLRRPFGRADGSSVSVVVMGLLLALITLPLLAILLQTSLTRSRIGGDAAFTLDYYGSLASSIFRGRLLLNSLIFALSSATTAALIGGTVAWLVERTDIPLKRLAYAAALVTLSVPALIRAIGWIVLAGPNAGLLNAALVSWFGPEIAPFNVFSFPGMVLVQAFSWWPLSFLLMSVPFRYLDPSLEEAANMSGAGTFRTLRSVTLPLALPSILAVLILVFIQTLEAFEVPAVIGLPARITLLTTQVYLDIKAGGLLPNYSGASAVGILLVALIAVAMIPYYRLTREATKYAVVTGKAWRARTFQLGRMKYPCLVLLLLPVVLTLSPLLALVWASFTPFVMPVNMESLSRLTLSNYDEAWRQLVGTNVLPNTLVAATSAATAVMAISLVTAWLLVRSRARLRWLLDQVGTLPLVIPGIVLAVAVFRLFLVVPLPIYGTLAIIIFAFATRFLPYGLRYAHGGMLSIHRELEESAEVSGANVIHRFARIVLPLMAPALVAGWLYVFLLAMREVAMPLLLYSPGSEVLAVAIWTIWANGLTGQVAAFSVLVSALLMVLALPLLRMAKWEGGNV